MRARKLEQQRLRRVFTIKEALDSPNMHSLVKKPPFENF